MNDLITVIKEFINKADQSVVTDIVKFIGIVVVIALVIIVVIIVRKLIKSINKGEKYGDLQVKLKELSSKYEKLIGVYENCTNTVIIISQYLYDISILIHKHYNKENINVDLNKMIEAIIYSLPTIIKSIGGENHRVFVWEPDVSKNNLYNIYSSTNSLLKEPLPINNSFAGIVFSTGNQRYSENIKEEKDYLAHPNSKYKYKSLLGIPIKWEDITIAVLTVDAKRENAFSDEDIESICTFGVMLSICLLLKKMISGKIK